MVNKIVNKFLTAFCLAQNTCSKSLQITGHDKYSGLYTIMQRHITKANKQKPAWKNEKKNTFLYFQNDLKRWQLSHKIGSQFAWAWTKTSKCPENSVFRQTKGYKGIKTEVKGIKIETEATQMNKGFKKNPAK